MLNTKNIRRIAYEILYKIEFSEGYSDELINKYADIENIRDFNLLRKLVLGVLERKYSIDYVISKNSKTKLTKIDKKILIVLRIAIYQMLFLDSIPDHASINEAVKHSKKLIKWNVSGYVNGLLRNIARQKESIIASLSEIESEELKYNLPKEIINYLNESYPEDASDILNSFYDELPLTIRVNKSSIDLDDVYDEFYKLGMKPEKSIVSGSNIRLYNPLSVQDHKYYKDGLISIQGEGSTLAVEILDPIKGSSVLDLCAAPGTKSIQIAEKVGPDGKLFVNDVNQDKNKKIIQNFKRIGFNNYSLKNLDAANYYPAFKELFDYILIDAPCSALGLITRKPEIRYRRSMDLIQGLSNLQKRILENAALYLKPNGILVYSTCTYGNFENDDQVEFIVNELGLEKSEFLYKGNKISKIQLFNNIDNTDGFFIAKFKKIEKE